MSVRSDAHTIIRAALEACRPDTAVRRALEEYDIPCSGVYLVAIGKAAWQMASCAAEVLGPKLNSGVVITKYGHSMGPIPRCTIWEGGHPVPDENSFQGTQAAMELVKGLGQEDVVIFLVSGGGSSLFEKPLVSGEEIADITKVMLACGANIVEINTIRKRLSAVKGGRFAQLCAPAKVFAIVLSDILGDPLDMIASGPAYPDRSTCSQAKEIAAKYQLPLSFQARQLLEQETPKDLPNVETVITGSVRELCAAAAASCQSLGYKPFILTDCLCCEAREAGSFLASIVKSHQNTKESLAFLAGGETVVHLTGNGLGGRNQELALAAAPGIAGMKHTVIFSISSDGTDGPTDAGGGLVDGETLEKLHDAGLSVHDVLTRNDAYHALEVVNGLLHTGPTGTNVNDVAVALIQRPCE